jgi:hypothetical protein
MIMQPKELSTARKAGMGLTLREMTWVGKVFYKSGMFTDTSDEAVAIVKIMAGQEIGLPPFEAMTGINLIKGRPTLTATTIASKIKGSRKYDYRVKVATELKNQIDFFEVEPDGRRVNIGTSTFTIEQAQQAGLADKDTWKAYPEDMLFARNISRGARRFTPDVFGAPVYTVDELEEDNGLDFIPTNGGSKALPVGGDTDDNLLDQDDEPESATSENPVEEPPEGHEADELDDSVVESETADETASNEPEPDLPVAVDDDFIAKVLSDIKSLDLPDIQEKRVLKNATGKITTKNLNEYEWRSLRSAVDDLTNEMGPNTLDVT